MNRKGYALLLVYVILTALSAMLFAFLIMVRGSMKSAHAGMQNIQASSIAEAGRAKARYELTTGGQTAGWGETNNDPFGTGTGTYIVTTEYSDAPTNEHVTITSEGYTPDSTNYLARRKVVESDIPLAGGAAGDNLSSGASISASSEASKHPAADAIDGSTKTTWVAGVAGDAWLALDFGSAITFNRVVLNGQDKIASSTIEYSSNGVSYTAVTNLQEPEAWTFTFDDVEDRYLRFNITPTLKKGNPETPEVDELETYDAAGLGRGEFSTSW